MKFRAISWFCTLFILSAVPDLYSYSIVTHEAIIDSVWKDSIEPMLRERFPKVTDRDLKTARAYAYGGSIYQDMGYYPLGPKFFTDLTHYVRTGDFVAAMLRDAVTLDEYAFALGALSHYAADANGHPSGTNRAVPLMYPGLQKKFGNTITYEDDPAAHLDTEFSFDVVRIGKGRYTADEYHDLIGFEVAKLLLRRSFQRTYGLDPDDASGNFDLAVGTYRRALSRLIPEMTQVAWEKRRDDIEKAQPGMTRDKFLYTMSRADFEKNWGLQYDDPGLRGRIVTTPGRVLPKGPFHVLSFQSPGPDAEKLFMDSFNAAVERFRSDLDAERGRQSQQPANVNLDIGSPSDAGKYRLTDDTYARLVEQLAKRQFTDVPQELRENILAFYTKDENAAISTKKDRRHWAKLQKELDSLRKGK
jgi:hypothetical protein